MQPVAQGEGQTLIGNAVVVPEYNQQQFARSDYLDQLQQQNALAEQKAKEAKQQRQNALEKYAGGLFNNKNFLTGTEYDPSISGKLTQAQKELGDIIKADPSLSMADIQSAAAEKLLPITQLSEKVKYLNTGITAMTAGLKNAPGVDVAALKNQAMLNATHDATPDGKFTLKDPDQIEMTPQAMQNYLNDAIDKTPELISQNPEAVNWRTVLDKVPTNTMAGTFVNNVNGRDLKKQYSATLYPFQDVQTDGNGQPVINKLTGQPVVTVRSQPAPSADGKPSGFDIASNEVYDWFTSNINGRLFVAQQFNKMNEDRKAKGQAPIAQNSLAADVAKKKIVYDNLSTIDAPKVNTDYVSSNDKAWVQAQINARQRNSLYARQWAGKKPPENFVQAMQQVLGNNQDYLTGAKKAPDTDVFGDLSFPEKSDFVNISTAMPGGVIYSNNLKTAMNPDPNDPTSMIETKTQMPYYAVWYNPKTGDLMTQETAESKPEKVADPKEWIKQMAPANKVPIAQAEKILSGESEKPATSTIKKKKKISW